ncbi:uncharacterized protein LOC125117463 isoform X1 [Phacochoerus africanus]|uniref:uncharacterized protein LOC125117463 isoform X1 n=1 Tax=Phacochoerus africanus TaxID=41426 RepID=UPI001FD94A95|nr:uncharacterized protein LOC125117463 isoform X1 [Phacochoerus africanus]
MGGEQKIGGRGRTFLQRGVVRGQHLKMLVLLLLLGPTGYGFGALVSQHPDRAICKSGASVTIQCRTVDLQAINMFWYHQFPEQGLLLIATSNMGSNATYEKGFNSAKFLISHPNQTFSSLVVRSLHPADSSLYVCGASDTALSRDQRAKQEPLRQPPSPTPPTPGERPLEGVEGGKTTAFLTVRCVCGCVSGERKMGNKIEVWSVEKVWCLRTSQWEWSRAYKWPPDME